MFLWMRYEFIVQNELDIQRLGNTPIGNNERYVQHATGIASNTKWVVDNGWRGLNAGLVRILLFFDKQIHINRIYISQVFKCRWIGVGFKAVTWRKNLIGLIISFGIRECIRMERKMLTLDYIVNKQLVLLHLSRFLVAVVQSCNEHEQEEAENRWLS
jgi:hypothetical protein